MLISQGVPPLGASNKSVLGKNKPIFELNASISRKMVGGTSKVTVHG